MYWKRIIDTEEKNDNWNGTRIPILYTRLLISSLYEASGCSDMLTFVFFRSNR